MGKFEIVRVGAAVAAGAAAVVYVLIGTGVVFVATTEDAGSGPIVPMLLSAVAFAALAALLAVSTKRWVLAYGIALQVVVTAGYFALASNRTPSFEAWGLSLKAVQLLLVAALVWLLVHPRRSDEPSAGHAADRQSAMQR